MENIIDENLVESNFTAENVQYGGFWKRALAMIIDGTLVLIVNFGILSINLMTIKNVPLIIAVSLILMIYKPYMEYKYGATLGKMALKLKVVNYSFNQLSVKEVLLRDSINIVLGIISIVASISMFSILDLNAINGIQEYFVESGKVGKDIVKINYIIYPVYLLEIILLLTDKFKRTLHDRIASTYVISSK